MNIHHASSTVSGDDHKAVVFARWMLCIRILPNRGAEDRRPGSSTNQVGLLLGSPFIHPFRPVVDCNYRPVRPDRAEEVAMGDFLYPGVDRCGAVLRPVWTPSPADHVGVQVLTLLMENRQLGARSCVVALEGLVAGVIDQCVGHAQRRYKVVNAVVLWKSPAYRSPTHLPGPTQSLADTAGFQKMAAEATFAFYGAKAYNSLKVAPDAMTIKS